MRLLTTTGVAEVDVPDEAERSLIGAYWNAVQHLLETGDDAPLHAFRKVKIAGHELETNAKTITRWAREGEIDFEDIYASG
jgi:hypothetical protein